MPFPWLSAAILFPIAASLLIPLVPDKGDGKTVRWYALAVALVLWAAIFSIINLELITLEDLLGAK